MRREVKLQTKVAVCVEAMWRAMSTDLQFIIPKMAPKFVRNIEVLEGDGGLGTVLQFNYVPGALPTKYHKEKIVKLDAEMHQIGFQVIEGGRLDLGFSFYGSSYQLSATKEDAQETLIDITILYEMKTEETDNMQAYLTKTALDNMRSFETCILNKERSTSSIAK